MERRGEKEFRGGISDGKRGVIVDGKKGRRGLPRTDTAGSKSDTIGIHIRSASLIRIDTYRASGAENMIASSPLRCLDG